MRTREMGSFGKNVMAEACVCLVCACVYLRMHRLSVRKSRARQIPQMFSPPEENIPDTRRSYGRMFLQ